jgi:hypothetical protein
MSYALFLDDDPDRIPNELSWIDLPPYNWVIVRSYDEFVKTILERGIPFACSMDHDIHSSHYAEYIVAHDKNSPSFGTIRYDRFQEKTGYDAAKWLAELCVAKNVPIPQYFVHTLNPIGWQNIVSILESARKNLTESK